MKYLTAAIVLCLISAINADDDRCRESALQVGDGRGPASFPTECREQAMRHATADRTAYFDGGKSKFVAGDNFILSYLPSNEKKDAYREYLIAGEMPGLQQIQSLSINERNKTILVVAPSSVKTFEYGVSGNIAPLHHISGDVVEHASFAVSHEGLDQLAVAQAEEGKIVFFHLKADVNGRRPENDMRPILNFETQKIGIASPTHLAFDPVREILYVYDKGHRKLAALRWKKKISSANISKIFTEKDAPVRLDFHASDKKIGWTTPKGDIHLVDSGLKVIKRFQANRIPWQDQFQQHLVLEEQDRIKDEEQVRSRAPASQSRESKLKH